MQSKKTKMGIKKDTAIISGSCPIEFHVSETKVVPLKERFKDVRESIHSLNINNTLTVKYKVEYGMSFEEFKRKVINMVFSHSRKYVEKRFSTSKVDSETIIITRCTDRIIQ